MRASKNISVSAAEGFYLRCYNWTDIFVQKVLLHVHVMTTFYIVVLNMSYIDL